jgi:peptidyl-prolyl cis-trans isomerase C
MAAVWAVALLAGCGRKGETPSPGGGKSSGPLGAGVVARVGDAQLTDDALARLIPPEIRSAVSGAEIRGIVDRWVQTEVLYQKAVADGLEKDAAVAARLQDLRRDQLAQELLQRELETRVRVSSEDIQAYYREHLGEYTQEVHLKHILVNTQPEAEAILVQLRAGTAFETLAQQRSVDTTAGRGGDLGFLNKDEMNPAFRPVVFGMRNGEHAGPILSSFGFHIVKLVERRTAAEQVPFEAVRDVIMHSLLLERQQRAQAELLESLKRSAQVQVASSWQGLALDAPAAAAANSPAPSVYQSQVAADSAR